MLRSAWPHGGPGAETEFHCGGEAHIERPKDPASLPDAEWAEFVFLRDNPKGLLFERWHHTQGCRRWFNVARDTLTYEILAVCPTGSPPPPHHPPPSLSARRRERPPPLAHRRAHHWRPRHGHHIHRTTTT